MSGREPVNPGEAETRQSSIAMLNTALRHGRVLVVVPLTAMVLAVVVAAVTGPAYVAESTVKPESRRPDGGGLMGLASQFGFDLGAITDGESVDYYARLLKSREILGEAVRAQYEVTDGDEGARRADLLTLYEIPGETESERLARGVGRLRADVSVAVDHPAGLITVQTEAPTPALAEQINARLLALLNEFNLEKRRSTARAEREFVEEQAQRAASELAAAESRLAEFLAQNRRYQNSPDLVNEAERLRRRVDIHQQVYAMLAQSHEQAKLDEVRNTPVFTVLDRPEGSSRPVGGVVPAAVLGFALGLVLAGLWVFTREYLAEQRRRHPAEYRELERRLGPIRRLLPGRRRPPPRDPVPPVQVPADESTPAYHGG